MTTSSTLCTVQGIHHIGIAVTDLEAASRFYQDVFGIPQAPVLENATYAVKGTFLPVGEVNLELLQATSQESIIAKFIQSHGEGVHHVCFEVDNIHEKLEILKAKGVPLIDQEPRQGFLGLIAFIHPSASRNVLIELAQHQH